MDRIAYDDLEAMLMDPSTPDADIAPYLTVDARASGAFDPRLVADPERVLLGPAAVFRLESALRWANDISRWRRARRFRQRLEAGSGLPVVVAEGDSWFQFPFLLTDTVDHLNEDHLVWSLGAAGDSAGTMVNRRPEYLQGLRDQRENGVRAFLFSGAGNDVIGEDAFGEPVLLSLLEAHDPRRDAAGHVDAAALAQVLAFLEAAYRRLVATVRADPALARLPILVHGYDHPIPGGGPGDPRDPVWAAPDQWLGRPLRARGITDPELQRDIVRLLIDATYDMLERVAGDSARTGVHVVDVRGCLPEVTDWADEIHPTSAGFARVADRFRAVLRDVGVGTA